MKDPTLFHEFNRTATPQDLEIFDALNSAMIIENSRPKRQAGFPGAASKPDNKYKISSIYELHMVGGLLNPVD